MLLRSSRGYTLCFSEFLSHSNRPHPPSLALSLSLAVGNGVRRKRWPKMFATFYFSEIGNWQWHPPAKPVRIESGIGRC